METRGSIVGIASSGGGGDDLEDEASGKQIIETYMSGSFLGGASRV